MPMPKNDNKVGMKDAPKQTMDDRELLYEAIDTLRDMSRLATIWASHLSDTRLTRENRERMTQEIIEAGNYIDASVCDILLKMRPMEAKKVKIYEDAALTMSHWLTPETDGYT